MTLKEKFDNPIMRHDLGRNEIEETKEQCVEIANEFAIGFGKWLVSNCYSEDGIYWWLIKRNGDIRKSTEELLEIYKKGL